MTRLLFSKQGPFFIATKDPIANFPDIFVYVLKRL